MYALPTIPRTPERPLDPPYNERADHDWAAVFRCHIGDEGLKVKILCTVTCADEIDPGSIEAYLEPSVSGHKHDVRITDILNHGHRTDIRIYFERNFDEIYFYNHQ